jgi:hypothetical protein
MNMEGWFNAKELLKALKWAIQFTADHGDENPFVQLYTYGPAENGGPVWDRLRVMVGVEDGPPEFTGKIWDRKEPDHFPYKEKD